MSIYVSVEEMGQEGQLIASSMYQCGCRRKGITSLGSNGYIMARAHFDVDDMIKIYCDRIARAENCVKNNARFISKWRQRKAMLLALKAKKEKQCSQTHI
jgi:hypothetical protein